MYPGQVSALSTDDDTMDYYELVKDLDPRDQKRNLRDHASLGLEEPADCFRFSGFLGCFSVLYE
jgi:hypothetical protein